MPRKSLHRTHQYARDVLAGKITAGPLVRLACERHERDRREEAARGFYFHEASADYAIDFIEGWVRLPDTSDDNGDPLRFILQPWQVFIVGSLFGWRWSDGGQHRRFRTGYIECGKGSGKTPMLAAIGLYGLLMDGQKAPEIYAAATDRDQAMIMFRDACRMVDASPALSQRIQKAGIEHVTNMRYGMGFFRPFSREQGAKSGTRPHMGLIDELHEAPTPEIVNMIRAGAKGNRDALFLEITNSGSDRTSICWQHHEHSRRILEGVVEDDRWFAYVCGLDDGEDPLVDEGCWIKTNPNLGTSVTVEYLRDQVSAAKNIPAETNTVLRLNFCVWTQQHTRAIDLRQWMACGPIPTEDELRAAEWFAGLDLGETDDFTAWARIAVVPDGRVAVFMRYWLPDEALARYPNRPYQQWERSGALTVTEGEVTDYAQVREAIEAECAEYGIQQVFYDPRSARADAQLLIAQGIDMVPIPQGFALNEAIKRMLGMVAAGTLCHGHEEILSWMAANFVLRHGSRGEVRIDKERAADKIDGIAALVTGLEGAVVRRERTPEPEPELYIFGGPR